MPAADELGPGPGGPAGQTGPGLLTVTGKFTSSAVTNRSGCSDRATQEDPDREMRIAVEIPIVRLLAEYKASCARYRELGR